MLYVCGGQSDPNLVRFTKHLSRIGRKFRWVGVGPEQTPSFHWELDRDVLKINGRVASPQAMLLRYDVFSHLADGRPQTAYRAHCWYTSWEGWLLAHPSVGMLNRHHSGMTNKAAVLHLAKLAGFSTPTTTVTNDLRSARKFEARVGGRAIAKPVVGGEYTQRLQDAADNTSARDDVAAAPALVQRELVPPEVRVYRIGSSYKAFEVTSECLDYRADDRTVVTQLPSVDRDLRKRLQNLTRQLGLDYAAADFKFNAKSGNLDFLEVNSAPMFAAFDAASNGEVCQAILEFLDKQRR
jgi:hypothetical protein